MLYNLFLRIVSKLLLNWIVINDKKLVQYDNQQRSSQCSDYNQAPKHFSKWHQKFMVTVFWSAAYEVHYSFLNPGETITAIKYCQQIDEMNQKLCPALVNKMSQFFLHVKTHVHICS